MSFSNRAVLLEWPSSTGRTVRKVVGIHTSFVRMNDVVVMTIRQVLQHGSVRIKTSMILKGCLAIETKPLMPMRIRTPDSSWTPNILMPWYLRICSMASARSSKMLAQFQQLLLGQQLQTHAIAIRRSFSIMSC